MSVVIRYFASVREALGAGESIEVGPGATVGSVRSALIERSATHAGVLGRGRAVRSAIDQVLCDDSAPVKDGAEIGFFPPVTGG